MSDKVLIVDDSLTVRMNLVEMLEKADLPTVACATLAAARQGLATESFALVILDVLLPDGDGIQLLQEIRAKDSGKTTAVMLLSTEAEVRDRIRGLTTGADEYVGKPYDPAYVIGRVRELVRRSADSNSPTQEAILLIDDSITFREEIKSALHQVPYRVHIASSGEEGLRIAANLRPSAVVVDGQLPGIDGSTVIRRIRLDSALRGIPCLLLTGSDDRDAEIRALDSGADAFVRKEESVDVILARIKAMLRSAGEQAGRRGTISLQGPKKVLAVDDSETYLQKLADALRSEGYELILARSGEEALQLLAIQPVDCILLDLMMPGIGGRETCQRIKSMPTLRDIPIIMLTAVEDRDAMIRGLSSGADDYIAKSSEFDLVRARVLAQIRRKQFEDEHRLVREQLLRAELETVKTQAALEAANTRAALVEQLELKNEELESFSYSVAHDLRAPLRSIDGFSLALLEDCGDQLTEVGKRHLQYVRESAQHMARLIDDLLALSRVTRGEVTRSPTNLSVLARRVFERLRHAAPDRRVEFVVPDELTVDCDERLLKIALENLIGNAWKFTGRLDRPRIELGVSDGEPRTYWVRDNGAGFDMAYASKLFGVFQRLHSTAEFEGTGIGLATVQRIIRKHGGRIWAEGEVGRGATFHFTLESVPRAPVVTMDPPASNQPMSETTQEAAA